MDTGAMDLNAIIDSITCPITAQPMTDPVQGNDGHTYERSAIIEWLSRNPISPIDRSAMSSSDLKVNASIRFLCDKYHQGAFGDGARSTSPAKISADSIKLDHTISRNSDNKTMLTFNIDLDSMPNIEDGQVPHLSQDIILVIDRSGSMNQAVEAKDSNGNNLENGLSIQDIVNHAARTVVKTLDKNSRIGIVIFDNRIEMLTNLTLMTELNCSTVLAQIGTIKPCGQTNIWHAIEEAIKMLSNRDDKTRNGHIMMLTDGAPNISPARGEIETLKRLRKTLNFTAPIYTFGFGYSLSKGLLYDMAKHANGGMGHIPDGGMIATVFCNFTGTVLATVVNNLQLNITYSEDVNFATIDPVMGDFAYNLNTKDKTNRSFIVDIGTVQLEQMRNIILNTDQLTSSFEYFYTYKIGGQSYKSDTKTVNISDDNVSTNDEIDSQIARSYTVEMLRKIINYKSIGSTEEAISAYHLLEEYFITKNMQDPLSKGILTELLV